MAEFYFSAYQDLEFRGCLLHDPLAAAVAFHPDLVTTMDVHMTAEVEGYTRGRTIRDMARLTKESPNVKVCLDVDADRFLALFMESVNKVLLLS